MINIMIKDGIVFYFCSINYDKFNTFLIMKTKFKIAVCVLAVTAITAGLFSFRDNSPTDYSKIPVEGEIISDLKAPLLVQQLIGNRAATKLIVNMEIKE